MYDLAKKLSRPQEEQYFTADPSLAPEPFVPMSLEELAMASTPSATPASAESVILNNLAAPVDNRVEEKTVAGEMGKYVGAPRQVTVPQVDIGKYDVPVDIGRQDAFKDSLTQLRDDYKLAQEDARSRQMKVEMMNAIKDNIGTIVGGAQAMNTKASVTPYQGRPSTTPDFIGRADKNHKDNYANLLKQYKDLQDGGLSAKDKLYADISNKQMQMQGIRAEANSENQYYGRGLRVGSASMDEQEKGELSGKEKGELDDIDSSLAAIQSVHNDAAKYKDMLGPVKSKMEELKTGMFGGVIRPFSPINEGYTEFRANAKALQGTYQKAISGLTVSEPEREELRSYVPNPDQPYETFMANARAFEKRATELRERKLSSAEKLQGKMVRGYKDTSSQSSAAPSSGPYGDTFTKDNKNYKWNAQTGKYQLAQ